MGCSRQQYWSGLLFPPLTDLVGATEINSKPGSAQSLACMTSEFCRGNASSCHMAGKQGRVTCFLSLLPSWKFHGEKLGVLGAGTTIQDPGGQASFLTSGYFSELLASPQFPEDYHLPFNLLHNLPSSSLSYVSLDILVSGCSLLENHWMCQGLGTWSEPNPD